MALAMDLLADIADLICELLPEAESSGDRARSSPGVIAEGDGEHGSSSRAVEDGRSVLELSVRVMSRASVLRQSACTASACEVIADLLPLYKESELYHRAIGICIAAASDSTREEEADAQSGDGAPTNRGATGPCCAARVCEAVRLWKGCLRDGTNADIPGTIADKSAADTSVPNHLSNAPPHTSAVAQGAHQRAQNAQDEQLGQHVAPLASHAGADAAAFKVLDVVRVVGIVGA